ncbi:MAG: polysialyltransferase family glycosyltransferase [Actinomycetota bacterium]
MTQLFVLNSAYGLATAAAAIDAGLIADAGPHILLSVNSVQIPETATAIHEAGSLESLRARFDRTESLNEILSPRHPRSWDPEDEDLPLLERLFRRAWDLDGTDLELFVQSPQIAPSRTLLSVFPTARITIVGDGLMTYSPMRVTLPWSVRSRIHRVVYADVVPGVEPLVCADTAARVPVPAERFRAALLETSDSAPPTATDGRPLADGVPTALVLGQYLAALELVTPAEEITLQEDLIDAAVRTGAERILFKPHPSAPPTVTDAVRDRALRYGREFAEYRGPDSAEILAERLDATAVIAGFSTALPTVRTVFDRRIESAGARTVLSRLTPFANSNRVPVTIVDALTRPTTAYADPARLQLLVDAVGYAMQPVLAGYLRPRAEELLRTLDAAERDRYFTPARLAELGLPGAPAESAVRRALRSTGGVGRAEEIRLTIAGARRRAGRVWRAVRGR